MHTLRTNTFGPFKFWLSVLMIALGTIASGTIVGVFPVSLPNGADTRVGFPLQRPAVFQGRVESVTGTTLTLSATLTWETDIWAGGNGEYHYCQVLDGSLAGAVFAVLGNEASAVVIADEGETAATLQSELTGAAIAIIPYWTPASLFAFNVPPDQAVLVIPDVETPGYNKRPAEVLTYFEGYGWYTDGFEEADNMPLQVGADCMIRIPAAAEALTLDIVGHVPEVRMRRVLRGANTVTGSDTSICLTFPEEIQLTESGLGFRNRVSLFAYENASGFNPAPSSVLTYFEGYGWYNEAFQKVTDFALKPGHGYILRMPKETEEAEWVWTMTPNYLDSAVR